MDDNILDRVLANPEVPGSFSSAGKVSQNTLTPSGLPITEKQASKWLESKQFYSLQKPSRKPLKRPHVIAPSINYQYDADTIFLRKYGTSNDNYKYIVLLIDVFSKYIIAKPLLSTKGEEMASTLAEIFRDNPKPQKL